MEKIRISLSKILLIVIIVVIIIMGLFCYILKINRTAVSNQENNLNNNISFNQMMNLLYRDKDAKYDIFDNATEFYNYSSHTDVDKNEDYSYTHITYNLEESKINIETHAAFDKDNKDFNSVKISINAPKDEIVKIAAKTSEGESNYLEYAYFLTRTGDLYYYTHDMMFNKKTELVKCDNVSQVVSINLGSTLSYTEEYLNDESVCLDNDGIMIVTMFDGSIYEMSPDIYIENELYPGIFKKIN